MTTDIVPFASPIDALSLIHNALRTEAERVEQAVQQLEIGRSFKAFQPIFYRWALALSAYVEAEEHALTTLVPAGARVWAHITGLPRQVLAVRIARWEAVPGLTSAPFPAAWGEPPPSFLPGGA